MNIVKTNLSIQGRFIDIAHYVGGGSEIIQQGCNIVTDAGLGLALGALANLNGGVAFWQVGAGEEFWDADPPTAQADAEGLVSPTFKKAVAASYWDRANSRFSPTPTDTLDIRVVFLAEEANGPLREFGLLGPEPDSILFNYVIHDKISKSENFNLERILRVTLQRA